MTLNSKHYIKH